jgi:hypothetical protein
VLATPGLSYRPGSRFGAHHYVFRRTNLPCLECGDTIRQLRQVTAADERGERSRITYFCPRCQLPENKRNEHLTRIRPARSKQAA